MTALALALVIATSFGPGLYGNGMYSGRELTRETFAVAHRTLPICSWVQVQDVKTGITVQLPVMDRGPARWTGATLDVTEPAVQRLFGYRDAYHWGKHRVRWRPLDWPVRCPDESPVPVAESEAWP